MSLTIDIHSFSYKKGGSPKDLSGDGRGLTFDCRGTFNRGRQAEHSSLTGQDLSVQDFLRSQTRMPEFLGHIKNLISITIENYLDRNFEHLQINFGCTGGQHRSVFCAEETAAFIRAKYPEANVFIHHDEQPQLNISLS